MSIECNYVMGKQYPYQVVNSDDVVVGIGKDELTAWENAAINTNNTLWKLKDDIKKAIRAAI